MPSAWGISRSNSTRAASAQTVGADRRCAHADKQNLRTRRTCARGAAAAATGGQGARLYRVSAVRLREWWRHRQQQRRQRQARSSSSAGHTSSVTDDTTTSLLLRTPVLNRVTPDSARHAPPKSSTPDPPCGPRHTPDERSSATHTDHTAGHSRNLGSHSHAATPSTSYDSGGLSTYEGSSSSSSYDSSSSSASVDSGSSSSSW